MQNFTTIGCTVAKISVVEQTERITPNLVSDKTHTSVAFAWTVFMALSLWKSQSRRESSPGSFDECRTTPSGCHLQTTSTDLAVNSDVLLESTPTVATYYYYSARKVILIKLPSHEGRRVSRPRWLVTYRDGLPARRPDVKQVGLRWSIPTRRNRSVYITLFSFSFQISIDFAFFSMSNLHLYLKLKMECAIVFFRFSRVNEKYETWKIICNSPKKTKMAVCTTVYRYRG